MNYETVIVDKTDDGVATLTLNRPEAMNSFTQQMYEEFAHFWHDCKYDDAVRAIVIRAAGDRAFCTGVDVKIGLPVPANQWSWEDPGTFLGAKQNRCWKPVIAAVHGLVAGGAFYILNECGVLIASDDAQFFDPHVNFGMVAALEPIGLMKRLPQQEITRMALMGKDHRMSVDRAYQLGLVSEVLPRAELWDRAHAIGSLFATRSPAAMQGTVRVLWDALDMPRGSANSAGVVYPLFGNPIAYGEVAAQGQLDPKRKI
jgi:enoyl-CoA hydratase/carnithine racemase